MAEPSAQNKATDASRSTKQRENFLSLPLEIRQKVLLQSYDLKIMTVRSDTAKMEPVNMRGRPLSYTTITQYLQQRHAFVQQNRALKLAEKMNRMHFEHELNLIRIWRDTLMEVDHRLCEDMPYVHRLWTEEINGLKDACQDGSMHIVVKY